jgi:hypothetical protein
MKKELSESRRNRSGDHLRGGGKVAHFLTLLYNEIGKVAEWFNASVLKTDVAERLPRVRLPPLPPKSSFQPTL